MDEQICKLAKNLVNYSCSLEKGEKVWIDAIGVPHDLPMAIVEECNKVSAIPFVSVIDNDIQRQILLGLTEESVKTWAEIDKKKMSQMKFRIGSNKFKESEEVLHDEFRNNFDIGLKEYKKEEEINLYGSANFFEIKGNIKPKSRSIFEVISKGNRKK